METFVIIIILFWLIWLTFQQKVLNNVITKNEKLNADDEENSDDIVTDEIITETMVNFEEEIFGENYSFLPDSISKQEIYIYKNLMKPWFEKLSADNRYTAEIEKIKKDWIDYLYGLSDRSSSFFSASMAKDDTDRDKRLKEHAVASNKIIVIENAFASAIGTNAVKELEKIRNITELDVFNSRGEIAPDGFIFDDNGKPMKEKKYSGKLNKNGLFFKYKK